jgi:hypothetical protein
MFGTFLFRIFHKTISLLGVCMAVKFGLTLKKEHRMRVFENRMLRRIFGPMRPEVTGGEEDCIT